MTVKDAIDEILLLLDKPEKWTKNAFAKNSEGHWCSPLSNKAVCWCLDGAVSKVCHPNDQSFNLEMAVTAKLTEVFRRNYGDYANQSLPYMAYNDDEDTTYEDILALLQTAKQED